MVHFVGVNEIGFELGIPEAAAKADLPLIQDDNDTRMWASWGARWKDVMILDGNNECYSIFSVQGAKLSEPEHYQELKELVLAAAMGNPSPRPCP